jgi:uncharacterized protein YecE (DUF72 family)
MSRAAVWIGTSGFSYPDWIPTFYPPGTRSADLLRTYAERLTAVELNNTFYQQPRPEKVAAWLAATPADFRFVVKAQRGGSMRAFGEAAAETVTWLTTPYRQFGERLGSVLFRVPHNVHRNDPALRSLLGAWPVDMPLTMEFQHDSWHDDATYAALAAAGAALCATDLDDSPAPDLRLTGRFVYLRLRRTAYSGAELEQWATRLRTFAEAGTECYVFLRHDEDGQSALRAERLRALLS